MLKIYIAYRFVLSYKIYRNNNRNTESGISKFKLSRSWWNSLQCHYRVLIQDRKLEITLDTFWIFVDTSRTKNKKQLFCMISFSGSHRKKLIFGYSIIVQKFCICAISAIYTWEGKYISPHNCTIFRNKDDFMLRNIDLCWFYTNKPISFY